MAINHQNKSPKNMGVIRFSDLANAPDMRMDAGYHLAVKAHGQKIRSLQASLTTEQAIACFNSLVLHWFGGVLGELSARPGQTAPSLSDLKKSPHLYLAIAAANGRGAVESIGKEIAELETDIAQIEAVVSACPALPSAQTGEVSYHTNSGFVMSVPMSEVVAAPGGTWDPMFHHINRQHKPDVAMLQAAMTADVALAQLKLLPLSRFTVLDILSHSIGAKQTGERQLQACPHLFLAMALTSAPDVVTVIKRKCAILEAERTEIQKLMQLAMQQPADEPRP